MKKIISTTLLALFLSAGLVGCSITAKDFNEGVKKCEGNGGLEKLYFNGPVELMAKCNNGASFYGIEAN